MNSEVIEVNLSDSEVSDIYYRQHIIEFLAILDGKLADYKNTLAVYDEALLMGLIIKCFESEDGELRMETREKRPIGFPLPNPDQDIDGGQDSQSTKPEHLVSGVYFRQSVIEVLGTLEAQLVEFKNMLAFFDEAKYMGLIIKCLESPDGSLSIQTRERGPIGFPLPQTVG